MHIQHSTIVRSSMTVHSRVQVCHARKRKLGRCCLVWHCTTNRLQLQQSAVGYHYNCCHTSKYILKCDKPGFDSRPLVITILRSIITPYPSYSCVDRKHGTNTHTQIHRPRSSRKQTSLMCDCCFTVAATKQRA